MSSRCQQLLLFRATSEILQLANPSSFADLQISHYSLVYMASYSSSLHKLLTSLLSSHFCCPQTSVLSFCLLHTISASDRSFEEIAGAAVRNPFDCKFAVRKLIWRYLLLPATKLAASTGYRRLLSAVRQVPCPRVSSPVISSLSSSHVHLHASTVPSCQSAPHLPTSKLPHSSCC